MVENFRLSNKIGNIVERGLQKYLDQNPQVREIYQRAREKNLGLIMFFPDNLPSDLWVKLQRIDIEEELQELKIAQRQKLGILLATACDGEYQISASLDGKNYAILSLNDLRTRVYKETFRLQPSCTRAVSMDFENPSDDDLITIPF